MIYKTQRDTVADHLLRVGSITPGEALDRYGIARLAARVNNLRCAGWNIETTAEAGLNRHGRRCTYARYRLVDRPSPGAVESGHRMGMEAECGEAVRGLRAEGQSSGQSPS